VPPRCDLALLLTASTLGCHEARRCDPDVAFENLQVNPLLHSHRIERRLTAVWHHSSKAPGQLALARDAFAPMTPLSFQMSASRSLSQGSGLITLKLCYCHCSPARCWHQRRLQLEWFRPENRGDTIATARLFVESGKRPLRALVAQRAPVDLGEWLFKEYGSSKLKTRGFRIGDSEAFCCFKNWLRWISHNTPRYLTKSGERIRFRRFHQRSRHTGCPILLMLL
jgi:hypothetical protein